MSSYSKKERTVIHLQHIGESTLIIQDKYGHGGERRIRSVIIEHLLCARYLFKTLFFLDLATSKWVKPCYLYATAEDSESRWSLGSCRRPCTSLTQVSRTSCEKFQLTDGALGPPPPLDSLQFFLLPLSSHTSHSGQKYKFNIPQNLSLVEVDTRSKHEKAHSWTLYFEIIIDAQEV